MAIGKKNRRRSEPNYSAYIHKVMRQAHPDLQISKATIMTTNALLEGLLSKVTKSSADVAKCAKKTTLSSRHVQGAVKVVLPSELAKHAVSEGTKAITKFTSAV